MVCHKQDNNSIEFPFRIDIIIIRLDNMCAIIITIIIYFNVEFDEINLTNIIIIIFMVDL